MIKIDNYKSSNYCKVYFAVDAMRPSQIWETKIGLAAAQKSQDYLVTSDEKIYKIATSVPCSQSIEDLKSTQEAAQEEFSLKIQVLRKKLEDFKLLQKLIKAEEAK